MELELRRFSVADELPASRRWPRELWATVLVLLQGVVRLRHLAAIVAIVVLIALMGASPQL
jgi:hypothetical protein